MQNSALVKTSSPQDSSDTEKLARQWAATFAELFQVSLAQRGPRFVDLWVSALADLDPNALNAACRRAMQVSKFVPTPAGIRSMIKQADADGLQLRAEHAWQHLLNWVREWCHPDLGIAHRGPALPAAVAHAARAAGGFNFLWGCATDDLQWAKKRFIEDFVRVHEARQVEHLLTDAEARDLIRQIAARAEENALPMPAKFQAAPKKHTDQPSPETRGKRSGDATAKSQGQDQHEEIRRQKEILEAKGYLPGKQEGLPEGSLTRTE